MKFTDRFFKFPYKMYTRKDWDNLEKIEERNKDNNIDEDLPEPPFSIGTKSVLPDEIIGYETSFSYGKTIDEVNISGPDLTHVVLKNGVGLSCLWSIEEFEKNLNEFVEKLNEIEVKTFMDETKERSVKIREILEEELSEIKEEYEKQGLTLPVIE